MLFKLKWVDWVVSVLVGLIGFFLVDWLVGWLVGVRGFISGGRFRVASLYPCIILGTNGHLNTANYVQNQRCSES